MHTHNRANSLGKTFGLLALTLPAFPLFSGCGSRPPAPTVSQQQASQVSSAVGPAMPANGDLVLRVKKIIPPMLGNVDELEVVFANKEPNVAVEINRVSIDSNGLNVVAIFEKTHEIKSDSGMTVEISRDDDPIKLTIANRDSKVLQVGTDLLVPYKKVVRKGTGGKEVDLAIDLGKLKVLK